MRSPNASILARKLFMLMIMGAAIVAVGLLEPRRGQTQTSCDPNVMFGLCYSQGRRVDWASCQCVGCAFVMESDCREMGLQWYLDEETCTCRERIAPVFCAPSRYLVCFDQGLMFDESTCRCGSGSGWCDSANVEYCTTRGGQWDNQSCVCSFMGSGGSCAPSIQPSCESTPGAVWNQTACTCDFPEGP